MPAAPEAELTVRQLQFTDIERKYDTDEENSRFAVYADCCNVVFSASGFRRGKS